MKNKQAIIIGAGPAGLTAAYELLKQTNIKPIIFEKSQDIGGLSKTVNYKGNKIDIGGHRFFSKSEKITEWWLDKMPLEKNEYPQIDLTYQSKHYTLKNIKKNADPHAENVMLIRNRISRIYYLGKFFEYPLKLSLETISKLGIWKFSKIIFSYLRYSLFPVKPEDSLEKFIKNRFGAELYDTFFREYTEKVWGVSCSKIPAEWGHQRIKGLSVTEVLKHAFKQTKKSPENGSAVNDKNVQTSLIEKFLYPKYGPGQMWELVAKKIIDEGGEIYRGHDVINVSASNKSIHEVTAKSIQGKTITLPADYLISTMPVKDLGNAFPEGEIPFEIKNISDGLQYRDFITVGILANELNTGEINDNWIYIQDKGVKLGRLQIFNNWSPWMVADPGKIWLGLEYFCSVDDEFWKLNDGEIIQRAKKELQTIGLVSEKNITDSVVIRMEKAYPAYFGTYDKIDEVRNFLDSYKNLFLIGRNGMHRYNNSDHSMLTAMEAVRLIKEEKTDKASLWKINTGEEYNG